MKQSGTAQRARSGRWPAWLVVQSGGAIAPWRNAPFALFIAGILAYGAAFAWYTLDRFDLVNLIRDGYRDDAFYYFQIAYHMAEGRFSTFDGGITRTNGYHPLWLFLITPFYWVFDKTDALFVVKAFEIMLLAGGVALVAVAARTARLPWILLFAVLPALYAQRGMLFGMEAAAGLFTLGLLFLATCLFGRDSDRWRWPLAAVVFALPWVRLECAAVAVAVAAALCLFEWSGRFCRASASPKASASAGGAGRSFLRLQAALPFAAAFAGVLVYFAYNGVVFGGVVPVSGAVKVLWAQGLWREEGRLQSGREHRCLHAIGSLRRRTPDRARGLRLGAARLAARARGPQPRRRAALGLRGGRIRSGRWPSGQVRAQRSLHASRPLAAVRVVLRSGVSDGGPRRAVAVLRRHLSPPALAETRGCRARPMFCASRRSPLLASSFSPK